MSPKPFLFCVKPWSDHPGILFARWSQEWENSFSCSRFLAQWLLKLWGYHGHVVYPFCWKDSCHLHRERPFGSWWTPAAHAGLRTLWNVYTEPFLGLFFFFFWLKVSNAVRPRQSVHHLHCNNHSLAGFSVSSEITKVKIQSGHTHVHPLLPMEHFP